MATLERRPHERLRNPNETFNNMQRGKHAHALIEKFLSPRHPDDRLASVVHKLKHAEDVEKIEIGGMAFDYRTQTVVIGDTTYRYRTSEHTLNGLSSVVLDVDRYTPFLSADSTGDASDVFATRLFTQYTTIGSTRYYLDGNIHAFHSAQTLHEVGGMPRVYEGIKTGQNNPQAIEAITQAFYALMPHPQATERQPAA